MKIIHLIAFGFFMGGCVAYSQISDGKGLEVKFTSVPADVLTYEKEIIKDSFGFHTLNLKIKNPKSAPVTLYSVEIKVEHQEKLEGDMDVIYGGSGLEIRPVKRAEVKESSERNSSSKMFEMVRLGRYKYLFAGALTWRTFVTVMSMEESCYCFNSKQSPKLIKPGEVVSYEKIVWGTFTDWRAALSRFGDALAREHNIKKTFPTEFSGWGTGGYYGSQFNSDQIEANMTSLKKIAPNSNLILIDLNWWISRGDYDKARTELKGGIKAMVEKAHQAGAVLGVSFDLFRADVTSEIAKKHPEYFLHVEDGTLLVTEPVISEKSIDHLYFDYSNPAAVDYMVKCIQGMKTDWGVRYFKGELLRFGLESEIQTVLDGKKKVVPFNPALTDVERYQNIMKAVRAAIGEGNYFFGNGVDFGPCIGFLDGVRTSGVVNPSFAVYAERCMGNLANYYLKNKVFNPDLGYLVFRGVEDEDASLSSEPNKSGGNLSDNEAEMWAHLSMLYSNVRVSGDNLMLLRPTRKQLLSQAMTFPVMDECIPLDLWDHGTQKKDPFEVILARKGGQIYMGLFNWSEEPKTYSLHGSDPAATYSSLQGETLSSKISLQGHQSIVLKYGGTEKFDSLAQTLSW